MIKLKNLPSCPIAITLGIIGNTWKLLIFGQILSGSKRFKDLHRNIEGISEKVLTDKLREMETDGLLIRTVFPEIPPRVEYSLSDLGKSMLPIFEQMAKWGREYEKRFIKQCER